MAAACGHCALLGLPPIKPLGRVVSVCSRRSTCAIGSSPVWRSGSGSKRACALRFGVRERQRSLRRHASSGNRGGNDEDDEDSDDDEDAAQGSGRDEVEQEDVQPKEEASGWGWRFPWGRNRDRERRERQARDEEADRARKERDGIFMLDIDNESLELRWQDLLDPTVENVLALILTGCLVLAVGQILWQLFVVAAAITVSAIKYTVLAIFLIALLVFFV